MVYADYTYSYLQIRTAAKELRLETNTNKTKTLIQSRRDREKTRQMKTGSESTEAVEDIFYLDSNMYKNGSEFNEIKRRIAQANRVYFSLLPITISRTVHRVTKIRLYMTIIRPYLWYGCGSWIPNKKSEIALDAFERKVLRNTWGPV
jgi:hypothetical protein